MTEFTSEFIAELKNIVSKATPTPYYFCVYPDQISENETHPLEGKELKIIACPGDGNHIFGIFAEGEWVNDYFDFVENNAEYIVIACNNLPKALDHIEHLQKRIAELEAQQRWIHQDKTMIVKKDGDSWCFVLPDFINLQESEAKFMDAVLSSFIDRIYTNLLPQPPKEGE